jgi:hypothetical protein
MPQPHRGMGGILISLLAIQRMPVAFAGHGFCKLCFTHACKSWGE